MDATCHFKQETLPSLAGFWFLVIFFTSCRGSKEDGSRHLHISYIFLLSCLDDNSNADIVLCFDICPVFCFSVLLQSREPSGPGPYRCRVNKKTQHLHTALNNSNFFSVTMSQQVKFQLRECLQSVKRACAYWNDSSMKDSPVNDLVSSLVTDDNLLWKSG